jgi:hypothetical protein
VYSARLLDDGQRSCPKHVEFYSKNRFEKLVHLVGFIIRMNSMHFEFGGIRKEIDVTCVIRFMASGEIKVNYR